MVPTSAITGDGMADLMAMMVIMSQKFLIYQLMWSPEVEATVMEVQTIINIYRRFRLIWDRLVPGSLSRLTEIS